MIRLWLSSVSVRSRGGTVFGATLLSPSLSLTRVVVLVIPIRGIPSARRIRIVIRIVVVAVVVVRRVVWCAVRTVGCVGGRVGRGTSRIGRDGLVPFG